VSPERSWMTRRLWLSLPLSWALGSITVNLRNLGAQMRAARLCIGGHAAEPYEQNTQQSPGLGLRRCPQPLQS
jgi:hypothetical protein